MGGVWAGAFAVVSGVCFGAVFVSAFGAEVRCGGGSVGHRDEMIEIAAVCGHGAGRVRADPVPEGHPRGRALEVRGSGRGRSERDQLARPDDGEAG